MNITINANGNSKVTIINNETTLSELLGSLVNLSFNSFSTKNYTNNKFSA